MGGMQRVGALAVAAIFAVGLTACGDDGDGGDEAADVGETTTTADDSSSDDTDLTDFDFTGECAAFVEAFGAAGASIGSAFSGGSGDDLEEVASYFEEVADDVPEDIRADFEVFAEAYADFARALAESGVDFSDPQGADPEALAALQEVSEAFSAPEVQEASDNINAWVEANCTAG